MQLLACCHEVRVHTGKAHMPLLADQNIHWRFLKKVYGASCLKLNLRCVFKHHPLHFGIWHAYKQCVVFVWDAFFAFFAFVEYPALATQPEVTQVTNYPRLILKERMIASMFLAAPAVRKSIRDLIRKCELQAQAPEYRDLDAKAKAKAEIRLDRLRGLQVLLEEYIPALFLLGCLVRDGT